MNSSSVSLAHTFKVLRTKIIQGRASQKWKQKDLAQKCNLPLQQLDELGFENLESPQRDIRGRLQIRRPGQPTKSTKRCRSFR